MIRHLETIVEAKRELPVALAHAFSEPRPFADHARTARLNRLFSHLSPADQLRCRAEFLKCREAKRDKRLAEVV